MQLAQTRAKSNENACLKFSLSLKTLTYSTVLEMKDAGTWYVYHYKEWVAVIWRECVWVEWEYVWKPSDDLPSQDKNQYWTV